MNPCELTMSITAIANAIACKLTTDETELLAAIFNQLGETLNTIVVQQTLCEKKT